MHNGGRGLSKPAYAFAFAVTTAISSVLVGFMSNQAIFPALEPAHAVYHAMQLAETMDPSEVILINLSGSGQKNVALVEAMLNQLETRTGGPAPPEA